VNDRPKTVPEIRGMDMSAEARERERVRERPYSAASYAAQYGITVEDAEDLRDRYPNHHQIVRAITAMLAADPDLKRRALMLEGTVELTEEEQRFAGRANQHLGPKP
jgi:hypothetical protein